MQWEYEQIKLIFQDQIRLSPFDSSKAINILSDGASSKVIGFVFYQHPDESNPSDDVTIVQANSSALQDSHLGIPQSIARSLHLSWPPMPATTTYMVHL